MNVGDLRFLLAQLDDDAPVLIDGEYCPVEVKGFDSVITSVGDGMVRTISLVPVRDTDEDEEL